MAAKIMVLPGAATHAFGAVQPLCDFTIAMSRQRAIEGPHHQNETAHTPARERKRRRAKAVPFDGVPKSVRRLQTQAGAGINRQLDRERRPLGRECGQVKPVRCAGKRYDAVPAIWPTAQFVIGKPVPIKGIPPSIAGRTVLTER